MTAETAFLEELTALDSKVQDTTTRIAAGEVIDVSDLDQAIRALCERATKVGSSERDAVKARLAELDRHLAELAAAIQQRLPSDQDSPAEHGRAAAAYGGPKAQD